jgi:hypothetical protein
MNLLKNLPLNLELKAIVDIDILAIELVRLWEEKSIKLN